MKTIIAIAAGLMSLGIASITPAAAFHITPEGDFTADGKTSATKNGLTLPCKAHFDGTVEGGIAYVTGGSFKDVSGGAGCTAVSLSNLPWEVDAIGKAIVIIKGVQFSTPIGSCGPGDVQGRIKDGHLKLIGVHLDPDCTVSANVITDPTLLIVKH